MVGAAGLLVAGLALGVLTLVTALRSPFSLAGSVEGGPGLLLTAAWTCTLAGAATLSSRGVRRVPAVLLVLAGLAWLVPEWDGPDAPAVLYAAGLVLSAVTPALIVHGVLAWSGGRITDAADRWVVGLGYVVCLGLAGLAPALVLDPVGCTGCPANPWLVRAEPEVAVLLERVGGNAAAVWLACAAVVVAMRPGHGGGSRPAALRWPAAALLLVLLVRELAGLSGLGERAVLPRLLWVAASVALTVTGAGAAWQLVLARQARRSLHRIVLDLSRGTRRGRLREAFAERLHDPTLQLLYPTADGSVVDAQGRRVDAGPDRAVAPLASEGTLVALVSHAADVPVSAEALNELVAATRLGLEHESLTARALAEERELRESGRRLLATRDAERRRLERDLHDGAQQRLVGMALGLQVLERRCPGPLVAEAREELRLAIAELRATAQGLAPAVLVDAGVGPALRALAETRPVSVEVETAERLDPVLETTVYQLVERATRRAPGRVELVRRDGALDVRVDVTGAVPDLTVVADRAVTLDGRMTVRHVDGRTEIGMTLPVSPRGG